MGASFILITSLLCSLLLHSLHNYAIAGSALLNLSKTLRFILSSSLLAVQVYILLEVHDFIVSIVLLLLLLSFTLCLSPFVLRHSKLLHFYLLICSAVLIFDLLI